MSGMAGIFRRDDEPVEVTAIEAMTRALAARGPDALEWWSRGPVGMGHAMLATVPGAGRERQPATDPTGACRLVMDGRLDNRGALVRALAPDAPPADLSDPDLVLLAYRRWETDCPGFLDGDFAFALWDDRVRRLLCVRDALGIRPFYYTLDARVFRWASEWRALMADPGVTATPHEGVVAELLAGTPVSVAQTIYRGIYRLPAAHALAIDADRWRVWRYWDPDPAELRYRSDDQYAEQFLELFRDAVRVRLRADRPVGAHLSGGLDSSSVLMTATALAREAGGPPIEAFAQVFPGLPCDESPYIDEVARVTGAPCTRVPPPPFDVGTFLGHVRRHADLPDMPTGYPLSEPLLRAAADKGVRVLLTGLGGDQWLSGSVAYHADLFWRGRLATMVRAMRAARPDTDLEWFWGDFLRLLVVPRLPAPVRRWGRVLRGRPPFPTWIDRGLAARAGLAERLAAGGLAPDHGSLVRAELKRLLVSPWEELMKEAQNRAGAAHGIEHRHPFYDRRLVEFLLALPESQRQRGPYTKFVLRRAMRDTLPPLVRDRHTKADLSLLFPPVLRRLRGPEPFEEWAVARAGWVDPAELAAEYDRFERRTAAGDSGHGAAEFTLWLVFGVEQWTRGVLGGARAVERRAPSAALMSQ